MSVVSYLEALAAKRAENLEALARVEDGDSLKHARIKGTMQGLDEAAAIFKAQQRRDNEE